MSLVPADQAQSGKSSKNSLKLGLNIGFALGNPEATKAATAMVKEAEELGYDSLWTAEAYGSDALTPLAWLGAVTERIKLCTGIMQLSARQPAATAMAAMTLDALSQGRFFIGLGASGPQVVEGWYGMPFEKPLARTREYVQIMRDVIAREKPVTNDGPHYPLPYPEGTGLGKPLKALIHPLRNDMPIFLAGSGPKNVALAAEICDGLLPIFMSPKNQHLFTEPLAEGFARPGARRTVDDFEIALTVPVVVNDSVEAAADQVRHFIALYMGGMGAKNANFYANLFKRMGFEQLVDEVQDLYLGGKKMEAAAKIPLPLIEELTLIGPKEKIRDELDAWRESAVTTLVINGDLTTVRTMAELVGT